MRALWRSLWLALCALLLAACTRGPEVPRLERDVQSRVDALFGRQVLALETCRRQGSAPYRSADDGTSQIIVYYNGIFRFAEAYDPSNWQGLSPTMIANALGAADEGVTGLKAGPNEPGRELRVYGSIVYRKSGKDWEPADLVAPRPAAAAAPGAPPSASRSDELVRRLAEIVQKAPSPRGRSDQIITEELTRALDNIRLRTGAGETALAIAAGPEDGEYWRFMTSVVSRIDGPAPVTIAPSAGSVENALLVDRGDARVGLVQSDVAAAAAAGDGIFAGTGPLGHLRAVAGLFPEPVHVVVRADSDIATLGDVVGRRVALGALASGTRQTALRLLEAAGIDVRQVTAAEAGTPQEALDLLTKGQVDAVIEVVSAPWRQLEIAMHAATLRLVPIALETRVQIGAAGRGLFPLSIPARTYPGQDAPVPTVAATALMVTRDDVPDAVVTNALDVLFASAASGGAGVQATRLSKARARDGVTIPMHQAATAYFGPVEAAPSVAAPAPAQPPD